MIKKRERISGVYAIINNLNGNMYIGSSKDIYKRYTQHKSAFKDELHNYHSYVFQNAVKKYGIDNFRLEILEKCPPDKLLEYEHRWIQKLRPSYNVAQSPIDPINSRDLDKLKPKELWKPQKGHKQSEDSKRKISNTMKGKAPSRQCIEKSIQLKKKKVILECTDIDNILFDSLTDCGIFLGISIKYASLIKNKNIVYKGKYKIKDYD